jgi:hypothetical protein
VPNLIEVRVDSERGCGWRKAGGLYLVSSGLSRPCGMLPVRLERCPTCDCGIKPTRGWTWVNAEALVAGKTCDADAAACAACPLSQGIGRAGLLWIGEQFYATPEDFTREAARMGVSRRISAVPRGFELGKTWVLVAHRKVFRNPDGSYTGGIFHAFTPSAVEYVVKGDETEEQLAKMIEDGVTPVRVEKTEDRPLFELEGVH